jgi:hypothetical protein
LMCPIHLQSFLVFLNHFPQCVLKQNWEKKAFLLSRSCWIRNLPDVYLSIRILFFFHLNTF